MILFNKLQDFAKSLINYNFENKYNYLFLSFLFALSIGQSPFFEENHVNLLRSLANSDFNKLTNDWLAQQTDHVPIFTFLSTYLIKFFSLKAINVLHILLSIVYALSIFLLCKKIIFKNLSVELTILWFLLLFIIFKEKSFVNGVAGQYLLNPVYQASTFGIFLISSWVSFIYKKEYFSILFAISAAAIHPTYLLQAFFLISGFLFYFLFKKKYKFFFKISISSLILVTPVVFYIFANFILYDPIINFEAQKIQSELRVPHHAHVKSWFSSKDFQTLAVILVALIIGFKDQRFFIPLIIVFLMSLSLSIYQFYTSNNFLGLLFPWRSSVYIVPVCSMIILSKILTILYSKYLISHANIYKLLNLISIILIITVSIIGLKKTVNSTSNKNLNFPIASEIKKYSNNIERILIPVDLQRMRLNTGIPIFIDWKSTPFKNDETLEWYDRIKLTNSFFHTENLNKQNELLQKITKKDHISHVLIRDYEKEHILDECNLIFKNYGYLFYEIKDCFSSQN